MCVITYYSLISVSVCGILATEQISTQEGNTLGHKHRKRYETWSVVDKNWHQSKYMQRSGYL